LDNNNNNDNDNDNNKSRQAIEWARKSRRSGQVYKDLEREIKRLWKVETKVTPTVEGDLRTVPNVKENLRTAETTVSSKSCTPGNRMKDTRFNQSIKFIISVAHCRLDFTSPAGSD